MDTLALLVILIGVVVITWITVSYMEIEKLKTTVNGGKKENEVIQSVGEVATPFDAIGQAWGKVVDSLTDSMKVLFNGKIPKLEEDKIYYLCHPCTTGSRTMIENKEREEALYIRIIERNPEIKVIRPLQIIPDNMPHEEAMERCFKMLDAAHAIILPLGWNGSNGCTQEHNRAEEKDIEKIFLNTN